MIMIGRFLMLQQHTRYCTVRTVYCTRTRIAAAKIYARGADRAQTRRDTDVVKTINLNFIYFGQQKGWSRVEIEETKHETKRHARTAIT